jgi:hypothetical protein
MKLALLITILTAIPALASNDISWVASTGSDMNPCTRTQPCATFQAAVNATNSGGVVKAADGADFGPVTINAPITIDGNGTGASINVPSGVNGVSIPNFMADTVVIRDLIINASTATANTGRGIDTGSSIEIEKVTITGNYKTGILIQNSTGPIQATIKNSTIVGRSATTCVYINVGGGSVTIRDSLIQHCQYGLYMEGNPATVLMERSEVSYAPYVGIFVDGTIGSAVLRYSDCVVTQTGQGLYMQNGGQIITFRTNMLAGNTTDGSTPFSISLK